MQIKRISYQVRGFVRLANYAIRWVRMVTDKAKHKARVLVFFAKHGLVATTEAFNISKRTLYLWQSQQRRNPLNLEALNEKSKRPKIVRKRTWNKIVVNEIKRVRQEHPNLGKEKIFVHLQAFCLKHNLTCPKPKTIGRIIADSPDKMRTYPIKVRHDGTIVQRHKSQVLRKPKQFRATHPGHCVSLDTIEFNVWGKRVYVITMIDLYSRFALALTTTSHASSAAKDFFNNYVTKLFPYSIQYILTDNGSEFMKDFDDELRRLHLTHWHTYPRTPKMNAHCERFNRTIQNEFFLNNAHLLLEPNKCNQELTTWLEWYNTTRPHWSLKLISPRQFIHNYEQTRS